MHLHHDTCVYLKALVVVSKGDKFQSTVNISPVVCQHGLYVIALCRVPSIEYPTRGFPLILQAVLFQMNRSTFCQRAQAYLHNELNYFCELQLRRFVASIASQFSLLRWACPAVSSSWCVSIPNTTAKFVSLARFVVAREHAPILRPGYSGSCCIMDLLIWVGRPSSDFVMARDNAPTP